MMSTVMKSQTWIRTRPLPSLLIAAVVVTAGLTACSGPFAGNCTPKNGSSGTAATTVNVVSDSQTVGAYAPKDILVPASQAITWSWQDQGNQHSVTANDGSFDSCLHGAGYTFTVTFTKAGTYAYRCSIHPQMIGRVTVT
jgi:plastocyanin